MKDALVKATYRSMGFVKRQAPTILTCIGAAGVVATAVMTAKATTLAGEVIAEIEKQKGEELTKKEKIRAAAPVYIPAVLSGVATVSCIIGANVLNKRHQASLISAYTLIDRSFKDYRDKVEELYGEGADRKVRHEITKEQRPRRSSRRNSIIL